MSETETEIETNQSTAGDMLQQLRKEKELSVQDVSEKIHLEPRIIEALEANNFDILPAATYARGYLRSYAKLLGADAEEIIALYNNNAPAAPEIIPEVKHPTQTSSTDKPVKAFSYLITLILVLLVVAWWQSDFVVEPSTTAPNNQVDEVETDTMEITEAVQATTLPVSEEREQEQTTLVEETAEMAIQSAETESTATNLTESTNTLLEQDASDQIGSGDQQTEFAGESETQQQVIDEQDLIDRRGQGPDEVSITLNADSWVEVFESDGDKLYLNLARAGKTLILRGTQPISVLLGFSQGAEVTFNGEQINHAPYSRSGIARFWLSNEGASIKE